MKKIIFALAFVFTSYTNAAIITLDMETAATGANLGGSPLLTDYGSITFDGEFVTSPSDDEFLAAGAAGNVLDILNFETPASLVFGFDVTSFEFIYGGNIGEFDIVALDINSIIVDSFYQADTNDGQPAGPVTLSGLGIRSIVWADSTGSYAPIDNITITVSAVPEPASLALFGLGLLGFGLSRCKKL